MMLVQQIHLYVFPFLLPVPLFHVTDSLICHSRHQICRKSVLHRICLFFLHFLILHSDHFVEIENQQAAPAKIYINSYIALKIDKHKKKNTSCWDCPFQHYVFLRFVPQCFFLFCVRKNGKIHFLPWLCL